MKLPRGPKNSIKTTLLAIMGGLTLMLAISVGLELAHAIHRLKQINALTETIGATRSLFDASDSLARERDLSLAMLHARDAGGIAELDPALKAARDAADRALAEARAAMDSNRTLSDWRGGLDTQYTSIVSLRPLLEQNINRPIARRDLALGDRIDAEISRLTESSEQVWIALVAPYSGYDGILTLRLRYAQTMRIVLDYTGRQRSLAGQIFAAGGRASPAQYAELMRNDGVLDMSWRNAESLAQQSRLDLATRTKFTEAKRQFDAVRDLLGALRDGDAPAASLSPTLWLEFSASSIDALQTLRVAARGDLEHYVAQIVDTTKRRMAAQLTLLAGAALLCALCFWVVFAKVIVPLREIVTALTGAAAGKTINIPHRTSADEIAQLSNVLSAFQDNIERTRTATIALNRSERRLRAVVDNAVDGLITIDARGIIHSFNPASEHIFGYSADEVIGKNVSILMPAPYQGEHDVYLERYVGTGKPRAIGAAGRELQARRKDGSMFPIDLTVSGIDLPEGQFFAGFIRDITERKQAEDSLVAHTEALERSNKELDEFAYIASHDLKEPLRGLHNHSRFLLEDNVGKLDEDSERRLHRLVALSQRMERLVNDLLYFSRLGRQNLAIQSVDLGAVVRDIETTIEDFLADNNARIVINDLPHVVCDSPRVSELLRNLITNAVKYNDSDEKIVEIGVLDAKSAPDGALHRRVFYVRDNGRGIAPEFHGEVFRIFKRLQSSAEADGAGVGLTFVKKIVERHGGRIWIESTQAGAGSTFFFTLENGYDKQNANAA